VTDGTEPGRVRTVFLGSGAFGLPTLRRLATAPGIDLTGAVTAPPRPAGRRRDLTPTPIAALAAELGIEPILTPERLRDPESVEAVLALRPELAVLVDYGEIVPPPLLGLRHGALNLHPSLLPRHRGATPIPAAIMAGDRETGVTLIRMDEGVDTGPIVAEASAAIGAAETAPELEDRLAGLAADLVGGALGPWLSGELPATPQSRTGATLTRPFRRDDGRLDPAKSAAQLERQVRALQPWPGSFIEADGSRLIVWRASADDGGGGRRRKPGTLLASGLWTADGRLVPVEVQPAGGRRMSWDDYLRGRPDLRA
jgi:methionyl-tRNA formyltransferase